MRYWRAVFWMLPASTAVPLAVAAYQLLTTNFSAYFGDFELAVLLLLVALPNLVILVASVAGAVLSMRNRPLPALVISAAIAAWGLTTIAWTGSFWDSHSRPSHLLLFAVPGSVALVLGVWGWLLLRASNQTVAVISGIFLVIPVIGAAGGTIAYAVEAARDCPPGPAVDLTFSGLENAHFTTSCGIPQGGVAALAGCTELKADVGLFNGNSWNIELVFRSQPVTAEALPYLAPYLIVGSNTSYGRGPAGWIGSYSFDPGSHCAGTVDAEMYPTGRGPEAGYVHVVGHFAAPGG